MQEIAGEVLYFLLAGGWAGVLPLLLGIVAGIVAVRGIRRQKTNLVNWGLVLSILALVMGIVGMLGDMSKVDSFVRSQVEQGVNADVADGIRQLGNMESYDALFWGIVGLMPGLWLWLANRKKPSTGVSS